MLNKVQAKQKGKKRETGTISRVEERETREGREKGGQSSQAAERKVSQRRKHHYPINQHMSQAAASHRVAFSPITSSISDAC